MNRKVTASKRPHRIGNRARTIVAPHPRSVPIVAAEAENGRAPDRPFEEGAHDELDPDLRHRMISEAAYALYVRRGYVEGFDVEDWLTAEAEVDHLLLNRSGDGGGRLVEDVERAG